MLPHSLRSTLRSAAACLSILALASACSGHTPPADASEPPDLPVVDGIPAFEGPWAATLTQAYHEEDSEYFRAALANGHISELEKQEAKHRAEQCMTDYGLTGFVLNDDGSGSQEEIPGMDHHRVGEIRTKCEFSSGWASLVMYATMMKANPDNVDWKEAVLTCLISKGIMEPGATPADVDAWFMSDAYLEHRTDAHLCSQDPLGNLGLAEELSAQSGERAAQSGERAAHSVH